MKNIKKRIQYIKTEETKGRKQIKKQRSERREKKKFSATKTQAIKHGIGHRKSFQK